MRDSLTKEEAIVRAGQISDVSYELELDLTAGALDYRGRSRVRFDFRGGEDTFIEFAGGDVEGMRLNGADLPVVRDSPRLVLGAAALAEHNDLEIRFVRPFDRSGDGFHRFVDAEDEGEYLYTQLEPYAAHRLMPCFDQPDLKAPFELTVTAPSEWTVLSAGRMIGDDEAPDGRRRRRYERTQRFSPYLMSVVAGPYEEVRDAHGDIPLGLYCRRSVLRHLDTEEILAVTRAGLDFFAEFFDHPYPFTKYDQIFVPEFNWGGMENVGNVTYADDYLYRDPPTDDQRLSRAEVLLHELAHQWFGDLVTMRWWDDVWLNESFASYMAYLALERATDFEDGWLDFNADMKRWAYETDQRPTTHRIADEVASTDETFLNFDGITYGKGASVLKQLVASVGEDAFRNGMRSYFRRFAFGNASLADFLDAIGEGGGVDLAAWSKLWLETPSLNTLAADWDAHGRLLTGLRIRQTAPPEYPSLRPHFLEVALVDAELEVEAVPVRVEGAETEVRAAIGKPKPVLVFPNYRDHAYAKIRLDPASLLFARGRFGDVPDALARIQLLQAMWDMVRDQTLSSLELLELVREKVTAETKLHLISAGTVAARRSLAYYVPEDRRREQAGAFVAAAHQALTAAPEGDPRVLWLRALIGAAITADDLELAGRLVDDGAVPGLPIDQDMRWDVALRATAHGVAGAEERAQRERRRDPSDRGERAMVRIASARPDPASKEEVWRRLHDGGYGSLQLDLAAMQGFNWAAQRELLEPYVGRFFDGLAERFEALPLEAATRYTRTLFPRYRVDEVTLERSRATLEAVENPVLRRLLIEDNDELERSIACRAYAARA